MNGSGDLSDRPAADGRAVAAAAWVLGGVLLVGVVARYGLSATALAHAFFVVAGVRLSVVDLRRRLLPNRIVLPSIVVGAVLLVAAAVIDGQPPGAAAATGEPMVRTLAGGAVLFGVYLVLALVSPRGLGMGDVKFAAFVGLYLAYDGWRTLLLGAAAGFVAAALVAAVLLALRRVGPDSTVPFGPSMFLGAVVAIAL